MTDPDLTGTLYTRLERRPQAGATATASTSGVGGADVAPLLLCFVWNFPDPPASTEPPDTE